MLKLNVGSGQRPFDNSCIYCKGKHPFVPEIPEATYDHAREPLWTNVDVNPRWAPDVEANGENMPMFADGSADMIVLHHVLEHYGCGESSMLVKECFRVLAHGGSLIVCVPEMRELAKMWLRGTLDTQLYMTNVYGAYMNSDDDRHKWGFDSLSLATYLMGSASWNRVTTFDWRDIPGASIAKDVWICGLECVK